MFSDDAQICYCGSTKCRGYISKASQITDLSSSEDSDGTTLRPEEKQRKKRIFKRKTDYDNKNKLREVITNIYISVYTCQECNILFCVGS